MSGFGFVGWPIGPVAYWSRYQTTMRNVAGSRRYPPISTVSRTSWRLTVADAYSVTGSSHNTTAAAPCMSVIIARATAHMAPPPAPHVATAHTDATASTVSSTCTVARATSTVDPTAPADTDSRNVSFASAVARENYTVAPAAPKNANFHMSPPAVLLSAPLAYWSPPPLKTAPPPRSLPPLRPPSPSTRRPPPSPRSPVTTLWSPSVGSPPPPARWPPSAARTGGSLTPPPVQALVP